MSSYNLPVLSGMLACNDSGGANTGLVRDNNGDALANLFRGTGVVITPGASTAAAGSDSAGAGALPAATSGVYPTTDADNSKGVRVHSSDLITGKVLFIGNGVSNKVLKVYPPTGGTINGASADVAFSSASGGGVILICLSSAANTWLAF
ncbi:MAG: hypothetical protein ABFD89_03640 [Bryobacteraceae bacterium]